MLIPARAGRGIGGATMFSTGLALIAQAFSGEERGTAFAVYSTVTGVAIAVGPVLGGVITSGIGWRWIFFVNVTIGVAAVVGTLTRLEESRDLRLRGPDWIGFLTFTTGLSPLVLALIRSSADGWASPVVAGCLGGAAACLVAFIVLKRRLEMPMFPFALLSKTTFSGGLIAAFALSASIFALLTYLTLYFQDVLGLSAEASGVRFLFVSGSIFLVAGVAGRASAHIPTSRIIGPEFSIVGVGLLFMRGITPSSTWTHLIPGMILGGVGSGPVSVPLASTAIGVVQPIEAGVASSINSTFRQVGLATGIAALGSILASSSAPAASTRSAPHRLRRTAPRSPQQR